jgi:heme exporter protein A
MMRLSGIDLTCRRGGRTLFSGLGFSLNSGEALVVTGRNGSGKSSLLRLIAGLLYPEAGRISLEGGDPELSIGEQAHYLGHLDALKPALTVRENLHFWTAFLGPARNQPWNAMDRLGLAEIADLPAAYLSAGQKRRLSLARLITVHRPLWLLDEPTAALDAEGQLCLADLMQLHLAHGGLIFAAAHGAIGLTAAHELKLGGAL